MWKAWPSKVAGQWYTRRIKFSELSCRSLSMFHCLKPVSELLSMKGHEGPESKYFTPVGHTFFWKYSNLPWQRKSGHQPFINKYVHGCVPMKLCLRKWIQLLGCPPPGKEKILERNWSHWICSGCGPHLKVGRVSRLWLCLLVTSVLRWVSAATSIMKMVSTWGCYNRQWFCCVSTEPYTRIS